MSYQTRQLAGGRWNKLNLAEQMANVGAEVSRAINWQKENDQEYSRLAFERALELLDLTVADSKNKNRLREICRVRECLVDFFAGDNLYQSTSKWWDNYFLAFNWEARRHTWEKKN